jgi:NTE family protein
LKNKNPFKVKIALALGGGGARGLSHLGVISLLEREGIDVNLIVGTSIGALVGATYAVSGNSEKAYEELATLFLSDGFDSTYFEKMKTLTKSEKKKGFFSKLKKFFIASRYTIKTITNASYIPERKVKETIDTLFGELRIEELSPKVAIVASDLDSGDEVVLTEGKLSEAVKASIAIAGVFPTVQIDGKLLIDGGYVNQIPVETAFKLGADVVIAVNPSTSLPSLEKEVENLKANTTQLRSVLILSETAKRFQLRFADVVITPEMGDLHWTDFDKIEELFKSGFDSAESKIREIRKVIRKAKFKKIFWLLFGRKFKIDLKNG